MRARICRQSGHTSCTKLLPAQRRTCRLAWCALIPLCMKSLLYMRSYLGSRESCTALEVACRMLHGFHLLDNVQAEKQRQEGVTSEGLEYARLNASRTAAQILSRSLAHHTRESQQEANAAEASEYKDEIKASIKAWAFQVPMLPLLVCGKAAESACCYRVTALGRLQGLLVAAGACSYEGTWYVLQRLSRWGAGRTATAAAKFAC
jgi:hypothetical protein